MTLVAFYYEKGSSEVFAVFPKEYWNDVSKQTVTCYAINEGHGPCHVDYILKCKPVRRRSKFLPLWRHLLMTVGYDDMVTVQG